MFRFLILLLISAAVAFPTDSRGASTSANLAIAVTQSQAITSVSLWKSSFTGAAPSGTVVGAISVTMSPATPAFSGTLSLSGTNASSFQIVGSNLATNGTVAPGTYSINIVATQSSATGSPFTQAETITATAPVTGASGSCPKGTAYADGCPGAPAGSPQYPGLLTQYGTHRPPWNVAGVDYYVGVPQGQTLTSWESLPSQGTCSGYPCVQVQTGQGGVITINGNPTGGINWKGIDFTTDGGVGEIHYVGTGTLNISITNSKFGCSTTGPSGASNSYFFFFWQTASVNFTLKNNTINFTGCEDGSQGGSAALIQFSAGGGLVEEYNYIAHIAGHPFAAGGGMNPVTTMYNFYDNPVYDLLEGNHMNFQQFGAPTVENDTVSFNTTYTYAASETTGGEGFQFYVCQTAGTCSTTNPVFSNNTQIGTCCFSNMVHGTGPAGTSNVTNVIGTGINSQNYFDPTATGDAVGSGDPHVYYYGSIIPSLNWTSSGNIDMRDGSTITPQ